jgi:hypothetical protein
MCFFRTARNILSRKQGSTGEGNDNSIATFRDMVENLRARKERRLRMLV